MTTATKPTRVLQIAAALFAVFAALPASALVDPDATQGTKDLYALLQKIDKEDGAAFGNQNAFVNGMYADGSVWYYSGAANAYPATDIQNLCGIQPALAAWDLNEFAMTTGSWCDANIATIAKASDMGVICCLSFHENNPVTGGNYSDTKLNADDILPGGAYHAAYEAQWSKAADAIVRLVRSDGTPVPVLLRPMHENSDSWFWWGTKIPNDKYIALWKWIVTYLRDTRGLHNILYVFNSGMVTSETQFLARWPGDDYVDVASCDVYMTDVASAAALTAPLAVTIKVAEEKGIPAALAEVGCNATGGMAGTKLANWWTSKVLTPLRDADQFRHIAYIMGWANWGLSQYHIPYPGEKNAADFTTYLRSDEIYLLDSLNSKAVWTKHARLGWIETEKYPWVYSTNHGWEYMYGPFNSKDNGDWLYDFTLGWLWTSDSLYPYFWSSTRGTLYYSNTTNDGIRWFYNYSAAKWESVPLSM
jgi:mannan endo-1,4-beta-mannosidase